jgi:hypothetical protein
VISSQTEYRKAREELEYLDDWLSRLDRENATERKGFTVASVRKMISQLQDELAEYEAAEATNSPLPEQKNKPNDGDVEHDA